MRSSFKTSLDGWGYSFVGMRMGHETEVKALDSAFLGSLPRRKSLGQHVYEKLKHAIIRGDLPPGERLVESRVAGALDISRTPVREAIHKLEREGLLERLAGGGFTVFRPTLADIEETFGIRCVLESYAARLAAVNHQDEELHALEKKIEEFQHCLEEGQMDSLPKINTEFHNLLYAICQSPRLIKMIEDLRDQIYRFRKILLYEPRRARISNEDHRQMLAAMKKRDVEGVERLVAEHILRGQAIILESLGK